MDPLQTLRDALAALDDGDADAAADLLDIYAQWRARGGFQPVGGDALARILRLRLSAAPNRVNS